MYNNIYIIYKYNNICIIHKYYLYMSLLYIFPRYYNICLHPYVKRFIVIWNHRHRVGFPWDISNLINLVHMIFQKT